LVDQIKAEREEFAKKLELPQQAPAALTAQPKVARARLESAYEVAVKDYTKAKNDERADSVEKELAEFRTSGGIQKSDPQVADRDRQMWVQSRGYFLKGLGKDWLEKWDDGKSMPNLFQEVQRTADYIELRNAHLPVTCRLYKDRAVFRDDRQGPEFKQVYSGGWRMPTR